MKYKDTSEMSRFASIQKILANPLIILASNWTFQGMRYMERGERYFKIIFTIIASFIFIIIIQQSVGQLNIFIILLSIIIGHTLNWIFNGQVFVLMRYFPIRQIMTREKMISFINELYENTKGADYIYAVLIFGSLSRRELNSKSDLDVRILRKPGIREAFSAYLLAMRMRFLALIRKFPLDVYTFVDISCLERLRKDEFPIIVTSNGFVEKHYIKYSYFKDILNEFKITNGKES
jgi:predicted nucleotidyltransferase